MKKMLLLLLSLLLLFPVLAACTNETGSEDESETESESNQNPTEKETTKMIYVTPNATGGDGSSAAPFGSISEAYAAAVSMINAKTAKDVAIHLNKGKHILGEELLLDGNEITTRSYSIRFEGDGSLPEDTEVTSNVDIPGSYFTKVEGKGYYMYRLRSEEHHV